MRTQSREFSAETINKLKERVAFMCSNPLCRRLTVHLKSDIDQGSDGVVRLGEAAHIRGVTDRSARFDKTMTDDQCKDFSNGIWLCRICARRIDADPHLYDPEVLEAWKTETEIYVMELTMQDTRLRQMRTLIAPTLTSLRYMPAIPGPKLRLDELHSGPRKMPLVRILRESEQMLFENTFIDEANKVQTMADALEQRIAPAFNHALPRNLDISEWKNEQVRILMLEVMRFKIESFNRYLDREQKMVADYRAWLEREGQYILVEGSSSGM